VVGDPPATGLAFVAAVALQETVAPRIAPAVAHLKWPNDLLVDGAKLSGILLERAGDAVVVGFGVNLARGPGGLERRTTSIAELTGISPAPADVLRDLSGVLEQWLLRWRSHGFDAVRSRWLEGAHPIGTALRVDVAGVPTEGLFGGLDSQGALLLRTLDAVVTVHAGDVFLI